VFCLQTENRNPSDTVHFFGRPRSPAAVFAQFSVGLVFAVHMSSVSFLLPEWIYLFAVLTMYGVANVLGKLQQYMSATCRQLSMLYNIWLWHLMSCVKSDIRDSHSGAAQPVMLCCWATVVLSGNGKLNVQWHFHIFGDCKIHIFGDCKIQIHVKFVFIAIGLWVSELQDYCPLECDAMQFGTMQQMVFGWLRS